MTQKDILSYLDNESIRYKHYGNPDGNILRACSIDNLKDNCITWIRYIDDFDEEAFEDTKGILLFADIDEERSLKVDAIFIENLHSNFFEIVNCFFGDLDINNVKNRIEESSIVLTDKIGENVYIGHNTYIGENVTIGDNVRIFHNVTIEGRVSIGDDCMIDSNTVIGAAGYGHYVDKDGKKKKAPHIAGVRIGKCVDIGANTCIERGCLDDTVIEDYAKIDSMVCIAHNDHIRESAMLIAGTCIGGSTTIGKNVWVGLNGTISDQIVVGNDSYIGMGTLANEEVPAGKVMVGNPAFALRDREKEVKIKHKSR